MSPSASSTPSPSPLGELQFLVGRWSGQGEQPASEASAAVRAEISYLVLPDLNGNWLTGTLDVRGENFSVRAREFLGASPSHREYIRTVFDSLGQMGTVRSPGWNGDRMVWLGTTEGPNGTVSVRQTIVKLSPDELSITWEADMQGRWVVTTLERLRRVG